jgi:hypothetical protein
MKIGIYRILTVFALLISTSNILAAEPVTFEWYPDPLATKYEFQISRSIDFFSMYAVRELRETKLTIDLPPGIFYARVAGIKEGFPGLWSSIRMVFVERREAESEDYEPEVYQIYRLTLPNAGRMLYPPPSRTSSQFHFRPLPYNPAMINRDYTPPQRPQPHTRPPSERSDEKNGQSDSSNESPEPEAENKDREMDETQE